MAINTTTSAQYIIKRHYTPKFNEDFLFHNNKALEKIWGKRQPADSNDIYAPIRVRFASGSTAAITEGAAHPTAAVETDYKCSESMKIIDTHKEISQLLINLTNSGKLNYRKGLDDLAISALREHKDFMNRAMFNDNGYIATCASGTDANTLVLAVGTNMHQFYVGQAVDVFLMSAGTVNSVGVDGDTIATINKTTRTITLTTGVADYTSIDSTYGISPAACTSGTTNLMPHGLPALIGTGTIHGVSTTTYPEFKSVVKDLETADVELLDIQEIIDEIELHSLGTVDTFLLGDALYRKIQFEIAEPQTQRGPGDGKLGTGPIVYRGRSNVQISLDICAYQNPTDRVYIFDSSAIVPYHGAWAEWMDDDGKYLTKVSGYSKYEAAMITECQLLAHHRSRTGYIDNCGL